jgi:antitoxin component of RelBE/YafQ-DinJ toxin-antitoxin module
MKTRIPLSDSLFEEAEKTAKAMGMPRSQLFAMALEECINRHRKIIITAQYDEIYEKLNSEAIPKIWEATMQSLRDLTKNATW